MLQQKFQCLNIFLSSFNINNSGNEVPINCLPPGDRRATALDALHGWPSSGDQETLPRGKPHPLDTLSSPMPLTPQPYPGDSLPPQEYEPQHRGVTFSSKTPQQMRSRSEMEMMERAHQMSQMEGRSSANVNANAGMERSPSQGERPMSNVSQRPGTNLSRPGTNMSRPGTVASGRNTACSSSMSRTESRALHQQAASDQQELYQHGAPSQPSHPEGEGTVMEAVNGWNTGAPTSASAKTARGKQPREISDEVKEDYQHAYPWIHPELEKK